MQRERYAVRREKRKKNTGRGKKREKILWILWYSDRDPNYGILFGPLNDDTKW